MQSDKLFAGHLYLRTRDFLTDVAGKNVDLAASEIKTCESIQHRRAEGQHQAGFLLSALLEAATSRSRCPHDTPHPLSIRLPTRLQVMLNKCGTFIKCQRCKSGPRSGARISFLNNPTENRSGTLLQTWLHHPTPRQFLSLLDHLR